MAKKQTATERVEELEQVLIDVWSAAQESDGSRGGQQEALDNLQSVIEDALPDVAEYEASDASDQDSSDDNADDD